MSHALGKGRRQCFRIFAARISLEEIGKLSLHRRSDRREHDVGPFNVRPLAKKEALSLSAPAFAVEELANCGGGIEFRCVYPKHVDLCDRDGPGGYYADAGKDHAG
ncbi:MAG: hypothetical protein WAO08_18180 [Hyphomicrobiaceae bacterium]